MEFSGISLYTITPAPITVFAPIRTPFKIVTFVEIQQLLPIVTDF